MDDTLIIKLADVRNYKTSVKDAMKMMLDSVTKSKEYVELEAELLKALADEINAEKEVTDAAFEVFNASNRENIHPHPAVTIKEYHKAEVMDANKAKEWCLTNLRPALAVDVKVLESAAKQGLVPEDIVRLYSDFRATIKQDLSSYVVLLGGI